MFDAFSTALSALTANSTAVDIIGNNLANVNTTGYKTDSVQFSDLMSQQLGGTSAANQVGLGISGAQSIREFTQGAIQQTNGPLDTAISGAGFFIVRDSSGQQLYTRAGNFRMGTDGSLLTANGDKVQGWSSAGGALDLSGPLTNITIPVTGVVPATVTANLSLTANLNAAAAVGSPTASFSAPVQVVDSQGGTHVLTFSFKKTANNTWSYTASIPAADLKTGGATSIATGSLTFDGTGQLTAPAATDPPVSLKITGLADGASDLTLNWNLFNGAGGLLTQFAQTSGVSATTQDGHPAGQIVGISMGNNGAITASYSNGQQTTVAQVALANIRNPESLTAVGSNNLRATADTAAPAIGIPDTGGRGKIVGGALEGSTVDMAREFTNLIAVQRSYQASSKVITTTDQMLQDLIALKQ